MRDVTLQLNLCAGDADYAGKSVPALVGAVKPAVDEVLIVLDCCMPQPSPVFRARDRFSAVDFGERLARVQELCGNWKAQGLVDRVELLEPGSERIRSLNRKYTGHDTPWTHDHLGHAFTAYFAAWEWPSTRYVLHCDADIFLHDRTHNAWIAAAVRFLEEHVDVVAVCPRIAPPIKESGQMIHVGARDSGWLPTWSLDKAEGGWSSNWLSTRMHFIDRQRLGPLLPLQPTCGRTSYAAARRINELLAPLFDRRNWLAKQSPDRIPELMHRICRKIAAHVIPPYPLPPEVLVFEHCAAEAKRFFYFDRDDVWYVHPETKPAAFLDVLDNLLVRVPCGDFPEAQRGLTGIQFESWR